MPSSFFKVNKVAHPPLVITCVKANDDAFKCFGLYTWDEEKNCYKQFSTDLSKNEDDKYHFFTRDKYLYQVRNGSWYISANPGEIGGLMKKI